MSELRDRVAQKIEELRDDEIRLFQKLIQIKSENFG